MTKAQAVALYLFVGLVISARANYLARFDPRLRWWHTITNTFGWPVVLLLAVQAARRRP